MGEERAAAKDGMQNEIASSADADLEICTCARGALLEYGVLLTTDGASTLRQRR